jgi:hypothetical protein
MLDCRIHRDRGMVWLLIVRTASMPHCLSELLASSAEP